MAMLAEVNGNIADFAPANCQDANPDLWVPLLRRRYLKYGKLLN